MVKTTRIRRLIDRTTGKTVLTFHVPDSVYNITSCLEYFEKHILKDSPQGNFWIAAGVLTDEGLIFRIRTGSIIISKDGDDDKDTPVLPPFEPVLINS